MDRGKYSGQSSRFKNSRRRLFSIYKKESIRIAKELEYSERVLRRIEEAKTENEISNILSDARRGDE